MADFKGDQGELEETTAAAAELNDDIIVEIVKRLPFRRAKQCSVLNKNIRNWISHRPNLLPSYKTLFYYCHVYYPKIFTCIWQEITSSTSSSTSTSTSTSAIHRLHRSVTLATGASVVASCNGVLLVSFYEEPYSGLHYVFNPTTSAITRGLYLRTGSAAIGLAVPDDSPFKLVVVYAASWPGKHLTFGVMAPKYKPPVRFYCGRRINLMLDNSELRPVYAHGSLYWLGDKGRSTVAFDVEKEEARLIEGPVERDETNLNLIRRKWFGLADGAVHFIYESPSEIVICRHDLVSDEWRVRFKRDLSSLRNPSNDVYRRGFPIFFDGRQLVFLARKRGKGGDIYWYDLERDLWQKTGSVSSWPYCKNMFFTYTSSFAEVSDTYLNEKNTHLWEDEGRRNTLLQLQKLLRPIEN